jgi:DNA (cytosine-5)-methyltransferase 1
MKPRILDLFCGAGGASMGYYRAGFDVVGVDIKPQSRYPFEFIQADWQEPLAFLPGLWEREGVDYMVHASPPCQHYSTMTKKWGREGDHPDLVAEVRAAIFELIDPGANAIPYVIENVVGAPLWEPMMLCGTMFDLKSQGYGLQRHRMFESNIFLLPPAMCHHHLPALPVYGHAGGKSRRDGLTFPGTDAWREGMGIGWMTGKELAESIPPAFTEHVGRQIMHEAGWEARDGVLNLGPLFDPDGKPTPFTMRMFGRVAP